MNLSPSILISILRYSFGGYTCLECNGGPTFQPIQQWLEALHFIHLSSFCHCLQNSFIPAREKGKGEKCPGALTYTGTTGRLYSGTDQLEKEHYQAQISIFILITQRRSQNLLKAKNHLLRKMYSLKTIPRLLTMNTKLRHLFYGV